MSIRVSVKAVTEAKALDNTTSIYNGAYGTRDLCHIIRFLPGQLDVTPSLYPINGGFHPRMREVVLGLDKLDRTLIADDVARKVPRVP